MPTKQKKTKLETLIEDAWEAQLYIDAHITKTISIPMCTAIQQAVEKIEVDFELLKKLDFIESFLSKRPDADMYIRTVEKLKVALLCNANKLEMEEQAKFLISENLKKAKIGTAEDTPKKEDEK